MKAFPVKKSLWFLITVLLAVLTAGTGSLSAVSEEPKPAGVAVVVKGEVKATTPPEKAARVLKNGDKIFMGDKIETGSEGQLQIRLLDQTVFTLGPLSTIIVDEFLYDPRNARENASVVKGVLRAVSAKVVQKKQSPDEITDLFNTLDDMNQKSQEAAQDRAQRSPDNASR